MKYKLLDYKIILIFIDINHLFIKNLLKILAVIIKSFYFLIFFTIFLIKTYMLTF